MLNFLKENFVYITALIAALKWIYEYSQKLRWEKSKFLLERMGEFNEIESTQICQTALDWNAFEIDLNGVKHTITDNVLFEALQTHDKKHSFTKLEMHLRGMFDEYFDGLTEFLILSRCGLINEKDFREFMSYWVGILNGSRKSKNNLLVSQFMQYMDFYGFDKLSKFVYKEKNKFLRFTNL